MPSTHRSQHHTYQTYPRIPFAPSQGPFRVHAPSQQYAHRGSLVHPRPRHAADTRKVIQLAASSPKAMSPPPRSHLRPPLTYTENTGHASSHAHQSTTLHRSDAVSRGKEQPRRQQRRRAPIQSSAAAAARSPRSPLPPRLPSTYHLKPSKKYPGYYEDNSPGTSPGLRYDPRSYTEFQYEPPRAMRDSTNVLPRYYGTGGGHKSTHKMTSISTKATQELPRHHNHTHHSDEKKRPTVSHTEREYSERMGTIPLTPLRRMAPPARPHPYPGFGNRDDAFRHGFRWTTKYNPATGRTEATIIPAPPPEPRSARPTGLMSWVRSCVGHRY